MLTGQLTAGQKYEICARRSGAGSGAHVLT
jgi:hypothetical protein